MYEEFFEKKLPKKWDYNDYTWADHVNLGIACDPENYPTKNLYGFMKGPFSIVRRCFMENDASSYTLDYAIDFHKKYEENAKFSFSEFMDGHEPSTLVAQYLDGDLSHFIKKLEKEKILDDTLVIMFSDHGNHMSPFVEQ
jgi:hypothetical protein